MKGLLRVGLAVMASCLVTGMAEAQQQAAAGPVQPGVVVVSYNKCAGDAPARLDSLNARAFFPALDELVNERRLLAWGVLGHAWGDEWNYVIYYTAETVTAFHSAFSEAVRRVGERSPGIWADFSKLCSEHKDNIYSVRRLSVQPPAP